jgi:hypothetical protein
MGKQFEQIFLLMLLSNSLNFFCLSLAPIFKNGIFRSHKIRSLCQLLLRQFKLGPQFKNCLFLLMGIKLYLVKSTSKVLQFLSAAKLSLFLGFCQKAKDLITLNSTRVLQGFFSVSENLNLALKIVDFSQ